ncbi:MAG: D-aminoacyl-tRNA deacylase, partial [Myxococcota bacterium]
MRAVVQRVASAHVVVDGATVGAIDRGLLVYLGVGGADDKSSVTYLADKVVHLRIFEGDDGRMRRSVLDEGGGVLVVSQFTLYGDVRKGRRPSFTAAAAPQRARELYERVREAIAERGGSRVATGEF